ncbi:MAG: DNA-3-methyladenine glycosylase family protein [Terriglobia bacterium]
MSFASGLGDKAESDYQMQPHQTITIIPRPPFNFRRTLRFALHPPALQNGREFEPLLDYFVDAEFRRVAEIGGQPVLYGVSEAGPDGALRVRILRGPAGKSALKEVERAVRLQFGADLDLEPFHQIAASDRVLSRLVFHFRGMRIPQVANPYETLVSAILEQQINLSFAHQVKRALIGKYGESVEYEGRCYSVFPMPEALGATTPEELRKIQISGPKAKYIIAISRAVVEGSLDLEALRTVDPAAAHGRLMALKGVGAWTAQYVGMRALGHLDCLPAADVGLQKAIQFLYGMRKQPAIPRVELLARKWRGWRSYATFYLWLTFWEDALWKEKLRGEIRGQRAI